MKPPTPRSIDLPRLRTRWTATFSLILGLLSPILPTQADSSPSAGWLLHYGLAPWQAVLDHDQDGFSAEQEFAFGTDPFDANAHPPRFILSPDGGSFEIQIATGVTYGTTNLQTSTDLETWANVPGFPPAPPATFVLPILKEEPARFFRFHLPGMANSDGDCLSDFEELNLYHTDPTRSDTDGDGLDDCAELFTYHTDPTRGSNTGRGSIHGRVVLDEDRDPNTQSQTGVRGWIVFLDLNFNGVRDASEPSATSGLDGHYVIAELDPGLYRVSLEPRPVWTQIYPTFVPVPTPDGYPDRVVELFDSGTGPIPFPYGRYADPLPGQRVIFPSPQPVPVDGSVVLGALPPPPIAGPFGGWAHVDILSIPTNSFITVAFDGEEIVDGPGPDLAIWCAAGAPQDSAELSLGSTASNLTVAGVFPQQETILVDLATLAVPQPVRYVKLRGLGMVGTYPGMDLVGFEALHYRTLTRGHYDITVAGGQSVERVDFGVAGDDRPPRITLSPDQSDVRAGDVLKVQLTATDDVGIGAMSLSANGVPVSLNEQNLGLVNVMAGGQLSLVASATDSAGQIATTLSTLIARNADGTLPDLSGIGVSGGSAEGGPSIQIVSPTAGEIVNTPWTIIGSILGTMHGVSRWQVHFAPTDAVNPEALDAPDADYVLVSEGTGPVILGSLGTLPADTLAAGSYVLRVQAEDTLGTTRFMGLVIGVRVDPLDIRPAITLTSPTNNASLTFLTEVHGSISTRQQLREWALEFAPLTQVNLQNLGDPAVPWTRVAHGTEPVAEGLLGRFDPSLLPNDAYVLRVSAWNRNNLGWAESVVVQVGGHAKLGNFAVEFTDIELPLAGVPITLKRVYNSLNANRSGDFGYGWSLALQDADIAETVPQVGRGLGSTPFRVGARVYLTAPNGQRIGFTLEPQIGAASFLGAAYKAVFKPDPGIRYSLKVPEGDNAFLSIRPNGDLTLFFLPVPWNPDTYILTDPQGIEYNYDQHEGLVEIRNPKGNRVQFTRNAITHSAGPELRLVRDAAGRITQVVAPDGRIWSYTYNNQGDLIQVTHPGDIVATFGYAANRAHYLEAINDPIRGASQRTEYDANGRVTAIVDAQGNRRAQSWDPGSFSGTITDARGYVTKLTYNTRGNIVRREDPLGGVTTWEYKNANFPDLETAMVDPRGNRTTYAYDARGNRVAVDPPGRRLNTSVFDAQDRRVESGYLTGGKEEYGYDAQGNLIRYKRNLPNGELTFTYTVGGSLASMLDPMGGLTRLEYDTSFAQPNRMYAPDGTVRHFQYDRAGRLIEAIDPLGGVTRFEYDSQGRLIRQVDPSGAESRITYTANFPNLRETITDRAGRRTAYGYDSLGRLTQITAPGGGVTRIEFDADGNRTAVVDPLGNRHEFTYDGMSRLLTEKDPLGNQRVHAYDLAGNRIESVDRNGRRRTFTYNEVNRLVEEHWIDPSSGQTTRTLQYGYDPLERLSSASDPNAQLDWTWLAVADHQRTLEQASYGGLPLRRIKSDYDNAGRRSGINSAAGSVGGWNLAYTRDTTGRLRIVSSRYDFSGAVTDNEWQLQYGVNGRGDRAEVRRFSDKLGDSLVSLTSLQREADCSCHLQRIEHVVATNQPLPEATLALTRDGSGNVTGIQEGPNAQSFLSDADGQLTAVIRNGAPHENYAYDANGNRTTSHRHATYTTIAGNRLATAGPWHLDYDREGNLISKSNTVSGISVRLTWDHRNRLTRVQLDDPAQPGASDVTEHLYDAIDRRIAVIREGTTNWTYYDGTQPLMDYVNDENAPEALYFNGERTDDLQVVWRRGQGAFWVLTDHLGSTRRVLQGTNGLEVAALSFDSYGNPSPGLNFGTAPTGRFGYAGREYDLRTGLYYNRARYYDPDIGRFISEDPSGFAGGDSNLYRYAANTPWTYRDPTGLLTASEYAFLNVALAGLGSIEMVGASYCAGAKSTTGPALGVVGLAGGASGGLSAAVVGISGSTTIGFVGALGSAGFGIAGLLELIAECF